MVDEKRNAVLEPTKCEVNIQPYKVTGNCYATRTFNMVALRQSLAQGSNMQTDNMQLTMHYNALRIISQSISESPFTYSFQEHRAATATHRTSCSSASCTAWTSKNSLMFDLRGWPWEILGQYWGRFWFFDFLEVEGQKSNCILKLKNTKATPKPNKIMS